MREVILGCVAALFAMGVGALVYVAAVYSAAQPAAQTSRALRFSERDRQVVAGHSVFELMDEKTDSCYLVVGQVSGVSITPGYPCPD